MEHLIPQGDTPTRKVLETCRTVTTAAGNVAYISDRYTRFGSNSPYELIATPEVDRLLSRSNLPEILDQPFYSNSLDNVYRSERAHGGFATPEKLEGHPRIQLVANKRIHRASNYSITGDEQLEAMSILEQKGVLVAKPLIAHRFRLIAEWLSYPDIKPISLADFKEDPECFEFCSDIFNLITGLTQEGLWRNNWFFDDCGENFLPIDLKNPNPLKRYISFDPVYDYGGKSWEKKSIVEDHELVQLIK